MTPASNYEPNIIEEYLVGSSLAAFLQDFVVPPDSENDIFLVDSYPFTPRGDEDFIPSIILFS
jgi:hypothetical protein